MEDKDLIPAGEPIIMDSVDIFLHLAIVLNNLALVILEDKVTTNEEGEKVLPEGNAVSLAKSAAMLRQVVIAPLWNVIMERNQASKLITPTQGLIIPQ